MYNAIYSVRKDISIFVTTGFAQRCMTLKNQVAVGLVGFGSWGRLHAEAILANAQARLAAVTAPSLESRQAAGGLYPGAMIYEDHERMLSAEHLDLVVVATPNHTHFEIASAALAMGTHVLLEKPMALTLSDCRALSGDARRLGKMLFLGHELRLSTQWGRIKEVIEEGRIGRPGYVLVELSRRPYRLGAGGWRFDRSRVGSWSLEEPVHFFDLARWYLAANGEPETVYAVGNSLDPARPDLYDNFSALLRYSGGAQAVITQTLAASGHHKTVKVTGTKGSVRGTWSGVLDRDLDPLCSLELSEGQDTVALNLGVPSVGRVELQAEIDACIEAVREGRPPRRMATATDGEWSVALCLAAEESVRSGEVVRLDEMMK
jgi:myo-inositol 2-dehydrogenase/D-chiro-inositol 1-dehydrogenase